MKKDANVIILIVIDFGINNISVEAFGSLSAIFDKHSSKDLGFTLKQLYAAKLKTGEHFQCGNVFVTKNPLITKAQRNCKIDK